MFKKKQKAHYAVLNENYVPASLPKYGKHLDTFITGNYRLLSDQYIQECYKNCEDTLKPLIDTSDRFTVGSTCDAYVEGQLAHLEAMHQEDVAAHDLQVNNIRSALAVRKETIERRLPQLEERREQLKQEIAPLRDLKAQFEIKLGKWFIPIGLPITLAAMVIDAFINYSFLEGILLQNTLLLVLTTICMSVMSDASMYVLGSLLSRKDEKFMDRWLFRTCVTGLLTMFLLSVAASMMIRIGTMPETFLVPDPDGNLVVKEAFSLGDWGVTLMTSFLTCSTGLISLAFSVDKNAHLVERRRRLEAELAEAEAESQALQDERNAIAHAADPGDRDRTCRKAAEANLAALATGLKQHVRKLLAVHQQEAPYSDSMGESAGMVLTAGKADHAASENLTIYPNNKLEEAV